MQREIETLFLPIISIKKNEVYYELPLNNPSEGLAANTCYFSQPEWAEEYLITAIGVILSGNAAGKTLAADRCGCSSRLTAVYCQARLCYSISGCYYLLLSGRNPNAARSALSLMCVARKE